MKINALKISRLLLFISVISLITACEFMDPDPGEVVTEENMYRDKNDANAIVKGIYGKFITLAEQYVVLNELRADLMDVTPNAHYFLQEINLHKTPGSDNPYADPVPFYELINQCNDALANFTRMRDDLKLLQDDYNQRYADIGALRSLIYLNLVIHFGEVPYITKPIASVESISQLKEEAPVLGIEAMVDSLVSFMETLPTYERYTDPEMKTSIDGYQMEVLFIDKKFFMGDLYLWDEQYNMAATMYKQVMDTDIGLDEYDTYKVPITYDPYNVDNYNSQYYRYRDYDINSALNHWPWMFSTNEQDRDYLFEWIWVMEFDEIYSPANPFFTLFSKSQGEYMLKPSQSIIDLWDAQVQSNGFVGDFRGKTGSYEVDPSGANPEITKYTAEFDILEPFDKSGKFMLQRSALLHLRFSEAANRDDHHLLAYHLVNNGIIGYKPIPDTMFYAGAVVENFNRTGEPFPYDFDGLKSEAYHNPPGVRGDYYRNGGIRGRVYLNNIEIPDGEDSLAFIENMIIDETALELAFEGNRWGDLVRLSIRQNDPSILADRIYEKLVKGNHPEANEIHAKLMSRENWFLPLPE